MRRRSTALIAALCIAWAGASIAAQRADNFTLLDQNGHTHKLHYLSDRKAVVLMVQANGCAVTRAAWNTLKEIRTEFGGMGVEFMMLNPNLNDDRAAIQAEAREFGYDIPVLVDEAQLVGGALGVTHTAEVFVIETGTWNVAYRGPIADRGEDAYLADALRNVLAGRPVAVARRDPAGTVVDFPHRDKPPEISYSDTIAPLLANHCVECHQQGGIAPWAMSGYAMVRGFAPMIREVVRTKRMPPWQADPHVGKWVGDRSLSPQEAATLVHWIESGAPRGNGPDPLAAPRPAFSEWTLGQPDLVLTLPPFQVPATGVVAYQYATVANPLDKPVWVRAAALVPGERAVVHHILSGYNPSAGAGSAGARTSRIGGVSDGGASILDSSLPGYVPGTDAHPFPPDSGVLIEPGGNFIFQVHYTPTGKAATDITRVGLYFHDEPPRFVVRNIVAINPAIRIPAYAPAHEESAYIPFDKPAIVYSLFPHAHYRGSRSKFEIQYPDGRVELLLSVPHYDFNWQRDYVFEKPLEVPAGAKIIHTTVYDNSTQSPANPDPSRQVTWGEQSWEEMLYGGIRFRWRDETADHLIHDAALMRTQQMFGYMDRSRDGLLETDELPAMIQRFIGPQFARLDGDGDGKLSITELGGALGGRMSLFGAPPAR